MTYEQNSATLKQPVYQAIDLIKREKGYDLILEVSQGGVVYSGASDDITAELVTRFDAGK